MRAAILLLALAACGPVDLPTDRVSLLRDRCDVTLYVEQCREAGLPTDVGVAWGCKRMVVPSGVPAPELARCVDTDAGYKCCETKAGQNEN